MTTIERERQHAAAAEERREILINLVPMLVVFALWLFMQVWMVGPLMFS